MKKHNHAFSMRKSTPCRLSKAVLLRVSTLELRFELRFLKIHQSKGFRENNLFLRMYRNSHRPSVLSCSCTSHLTLWRVKVSLLGELKQRKWLTTGCLSEILRNCVCIVLYEWHLVNYKICLFLVHNLHYLQFETYWLFYTHCNILLIINRDFL